jgi:hypothetical protein
MPPPFSHQPRRVAHEGVEAMNTKTATRVSFGRPGMVIVPDALAAAINVKLDAAIAACPDAEKDRDALYGQLLAYFDEHGTVPEFSLVKNP